MKIAVDKNSLIAVKQDNNEYIYLFDKEPIEDLLKIKLHCINYKYCDLVDLNLTDYDIDYIKKANINDIDYNVLPERKDYKIGIIIPNYNYEHTIEKCLS